MPNGQAALKSGNRCDCQVANIKLGNPAYVQILESAVPGRCPIAPIGIDFVHDETTNHSSNLDLASELLKSGDIGSPKERRQRDANLRERRAAALFPINHTCRSAHLRTPLS